MLQTNSVQTGSSGFRLFKARLIALLGVSIPPSINEQMTLLQYTRLRSHIPILYIAVAVNTLASAVAAQGDFPALHQFLLPGILMLASIIRYRTWRKRDGQAINLPTAQRYIRSAFLIAMGLSVFGGIWSVTAFYETHETRRVLAAIFLTMATFATANCLASLPRTTILTILISLTPISLAMLFSDDIGIQSAAISIIVVALLQIRLVVSKFQETVNGLVLQQDMQELADTDGLTGLRNRRAFMTSLEAAVAEKNRTAPFFVAMLDLNGFKPANDRYGHAAGDAILAEVARRLQTICTDCRCIARIGGDEFAVIMSANGCADTMKAMADAIRAILALPYVHAGELIGVSASIGVARSGQHGDTATALLHAADEALYAEKAARRARRVTDVAVEA